MVQMRFWSIWPLRSDSHSAPCCLQELQAKELQGSLGNAVRRARARLLLLMRYWFWRLEALRSRQSWDADVDEEATSCETLAANDLSIALSALHASDEALLMQHRSIVFPVSGRQRPGGAPTCGGAPTADGAGGVPRAVHCPLPYQFMRHRLSQSSNKLHSQRSMSAPSNGVRIQLT